MSTECREGKSGPWGLLWTTNSGSVRKTGTGSCWGVGLWEEATISVCLEHPHPHPCPLSHGHRTASSRHGTVGAGSAHWPRSDWPRKAVGVLNKETRICWVSLQAVPPTAPLIWSPCELLPQATLPL